VCTVRDANKLLDVIHEFEFWSGLRISIPKSLPTGAMYGTGSERRSERAKIDAAKRKRDAGPDILNPQIQAVEAMDEALDVDNTTQLNTKGQEAWQMNLAADNVLYATKKKETATSQHNSTSTHPAWNVNTRGNLQESNIKELT